MNLVDRYRNRISYFDEICVGTTIRHAHPHISHIDFEKHKLETVIAVVMCEIDINNAAPLSCHLCKIRAKFRVLTPGCTVPHYDICGDCIFDVNGKKYQLRE